MKKCTLAVSADLKTEITPRQFGGTPDCSQCGCIASMDLAAVGHHRVLPGVTAGQLFTLSALIGQRVNKLRSLRDPEEPVDYPETRDRKAA